MGVSEEGIKGLNGVLEECDMGGFGGGEVQKPAQGRALDGGEEAIVGIRDERHQEMDPGSPGLSKVHVEEGTDVVDSDGVVNVHDDRQVGVGLGEGEQVVEGRGRPERGVVGSSRAE